MGLTRHARRGSTMSEHVARPCQHIETLAALDDAIAQSHERPVLLFKHSLTCGASYQANEEVRAFLGSTESAPFCGIVVVQHSRPVSNAIVERLGVRHESPQALVLRDGHVVWHASHGRVRADSLREAIAAADAPA
jgi:bacillithiol system protein YtxJ